MKSKDNTFIHTYTQPCIAYIYIVCGNNMDDEHFNTEPQKCIYMKHSNVSVEICYKTQLNLW